MAQSDATAASLSTKIIGRKIIRYKCVASTNDLCFDLAKENEEGLVVIADEQSSGRGRFKRKWFSPNGGLYFSVLLKPKNGCNHSFLSLASSLAVANSLKKSGLDGISVKWPNDVLQDSKKIAGILAEKRDDAIVVGIGLNIDNDGISFPTEIANIAATIKMKNGELPDKLVIFSNVLEEFERIYLMYLNGENEVILNEIRKLSGILGNTIKIMDGSTLYEGDAVDFGPDGSLIMRDINDKIIKIYSGEIINGYKRSAGSDNC